ncbi:MAG: endolytic transglycosylase MltG [Rickettsiales bacterium]
MLHRPQRWFVMLSKLLSIKAALNPSQSDEYYFVAKGDGGHYFAKNLREHQANVVKYKAKLRELK